MTTTISMGVLLGQLFAVLVLLILGIAAIRFLLAATRLMKRKAEQLERSAPGTEDSGRARVPPDSPRLRDH